MPYWSNWSGALSAKPQQIVFPRSVEDLQAVVTDAAAAGRQIRVVGAGHSHAPLVIEDDGILVDVQALAGVYSTDTERASAWVGAGTRIFALGQPLHDAGLALINQGDIDQQAICGATATGTHGTGIALQNLSSAVIGCEMVLADGSLVQCSPQQRRDLWRASRLHLGAFGIITRLHLQLRPAYRLQETSWQCPLQEALSGFEEQAALFRHHEFFWYPQTDTAQCKGIAETEAEPVYPLADEGNRCGWSHEVLPNHRPHKHTEMEYSVPAEAGPACLAEIKQLLETRFPEVAWPVEYRTLAADDVWLSTAYERPTVTISVHQDIREDDEPYFKACEEIFLAYAGRPHWGKVNYLSGTQLAQRHPRWTDWWQARNAADPQGIFLNDYLRSLVEPS